MHEEGAGPLFEGSMEGVGLLSVPRDDGAHGTAGGVCVLLLGGWHLRGSFVLPLAEKEVGQTSDDKHGTWKRSGRSGY